MIAVYQYLSLTQNYELFKEFDALQSHIKIQACVLPSPIDTGKGWIIDSNSCDFLILRFLGWDGLTYVIGWDGLTLDLTKAEEPCFSIGWVEKCSCPALGHQPQLLSIPF